MAEKEVWFKAPSRELGKSDVQFHVWSGGEKHGTLQISKGSVVWFPQNARYGYRMSWGRLDSIMKEHASAYRKR